MNNKSYPLEDISNRQNKWNVTYHDYSHLLKSSTYLSVYQSGQKTYTPPGYHRGPDMYDHFIIHYVTSGSGTFTIGGTEYEINTHDMFLIPPYTFVEYQADEETPWCYYWVGFNGADAAQLVKLSGFQDTYRLHVQEQIAITQLFSELTRLESSAISQKYLLLGYLYQILGLLMTHSETSSSANYDHYLRAVDYIQQHYNKDELSVQSIAESINISRSHLYRVFKQVTDKSIQDMIVDTRLQKSFLFLENTNYSIGKVSSLAGFHSQSYFSKLFKERYNQTPTQYRKSIQN